MSHTIDIDPPSTSSVASPTFYDDVVITVNDTEHKHTSLHDEEEEEYEIIHKTQIQDDIKHHELHAKPSHQDDAPSTTLSSSPIIAATSSQQPLPTVPVATSQLLPPSNPAMSRASSAPTPSSPSPSDIPTSPPLIRSITDPSDIPPTIPAAPTLSPYWIRKLWSIASPPMFVTNMIQSIGKITKQISAEPEFFCIICQCNCIVSERVAIYDDDNGTCSHTFCHDCLVAYITFEINEGRVLSLTCPAQQDDGRTHCQSNIPASKIKQLVDADTYAKYERFMKQKSDDNYRACPTCGHLQKGTSRSPAMICERAGCGTKYCFHHSNAHPHQTCSQYKRTNRDAFKANRKFVNSETVHCPWCRVPILKASGCNHMTCSQCDTQFCYLCGGWYMGGFHFNSLNLLGCPGMQSAGGEANSRGQWWRKILRLVGYPLMAIMVVVLVVLAITCLLAFEGLWLCFFVGLLPIWFLIYCYIQCRHYSYHQRDLYRQRLFIASCWGPVVFFWLID